MEQHPPPPTFQNNSKVNEFLGSQLDGFQHRGNPRNLQSHVSLAKALYDSWNYTKPPPETNQFQQEIL